MRKKIALLLVISLSILPIPNMPQAHGAYQQISAPSIVLLDPYSERVLYARMPHRRQPAASTTKIVTALVTLDRLGLNEWVTVSGAVENTPPSKIYLKRGDRLRVGDLLKAVLMKSANDAAQALAIEIAGSERAFAELMTQKAHFLGARNTKFINASGLPGGDQYSTAYDLALIMKEAVNNPVIVSILKQKSSVIRTAEGKRFFFKSHNKMLWRSYDVIGKTGWTRDSRHCFLGVIAIGNKKMVIAMLGSHRLWSDLTSLVHWTLTTLGTKNQMLIYGARGSEVYRLQRALRRAGFLKVKATGYFGNKTKEALANFQKARGLSGDGVAGQDTLRALSNYY